MWLWLRYMVYESRDPVRSRQVHDTPELTEWDRYAISGYFRLADPADGDEVRPAAVVLYCAVFCCYLCCVRL